MSLRLTPEVLAAAYEYLRACPPFNRWKMPEVDDVAFKVSRDTRTDGLCFQTADGGYGIAISDAKHSHTATLMATMAHEMVHVYLDRRGVRAHHGADFRRCAALVCKHHGFDLAGF